MSGKAKSSSSSSRGRTAILGDQIMLAAVAVSAALAVGLGFVYYEPTIAMVGALGLAGLSAGVYMVARGSTLSRFVLTASQVGLVALHIDVSHGEIEYHFGVFVTLALLLVYMDWKPIVFAAGLFAVHHILFDRLQAAGFDFYCLTEPNFARILVHAGYVVVQTAMELVLVAGMRQRAKEGEELAQLVGAVDRADGIALDVSGIKVVSPRAETLKNTLMRMQAVVASVQSSSSHIEAASREIALGNQDLSSRTEQAASSLQQTAASMEQINTNVRQSADSANQASQMASANAEVASRGGAVVSQVVSTMEEIHHSSAKINDIIGVIDGIAFQTNILALNAAVEAARAGEQGRGFAVVAGEVRNLAQRSAEAAKEIKGLISTSVEKVENGTRLVGEAGSTINEIVSNARRLADIIGEITASTQEQSGGIGQVHSAVSQLDQMTQQNAALVEESSAAAESLKDQAIALSQAVSVFRS